MKISESQPKSKKKYHLRDVYKEHFQNYIKSDLRQLYLEDIHFEAVNKSSACQTSKLGKGILVCKECAEVTYISRSCKHRFCGMCGTADTYKWADRMLKRLMDIPHHHVTFTLPKFYRLLSKRNCNKLHNLLFESSSKVVQKYFRDKYNLRVGLVEVLHTAGSDLKYHPHIHMICSRGGQDISTGEYREVPGTWLCKNELLGKALKQEFNLGLRKLYEKGSLKVYSKIKNTKDLLSWQAGQNEKHWIVNIEEPLADINQIIGYVGRYTKRACISESRIEYVGSDSVRFSCNDYKNSVRGEPARKKIVDQSGIEFLDNLLQHVPTKRYRMIRYYGLYNSYYLRKIPELYRLKISGKDIVVMEQELESELLLEYRKAFIRKGKPDPLLCKNCGVLKELVGLEYEKEGKVEIYLFEDSG